ncbi:MAG TPA: alpha/beta fold hydrolase [Actinomycetota bacterium]|nr:alpha/beta fold hydrolase [Actinomycetota bacterium]
MEAKTLTLHGSSIAYRTAGEGPVVVLIHGMAGSSETWEPVIPLLAKHATIVAPDMIGHGTSAKPKGDYSLGALASSVRDVMVALGHSRATIVGHSLGGGVAMQFAYQFPERSERLVLVASGGLGREVSTLLRALSLPGAEYVLSIGTASRLRGASDAIAGWLGKVGLRPAPGAAEILRSYASLGDRETRTAFLHTLRAVIDVGGQRVSARDRLYLTQDMPTMIAWGDRDPIIPISHAYEAHDAMPGSILKIYPGAGHYPHCHDPQRFADDLLGFMSSTTPASITAEQLRARIMTGA